jgi:CheY-like chemotaxis protein
MKKVLVIEDTEDNMELISFILEQNGYQIIKAETGMEGVAMTLDERPDFIILDIQLPDIDGYEVLQRIRSSESNGSIPIIAMTSFAMTGDKERLLAAGCNGYIEKPIDPRLVISQIKNVLGET